MTSLARYKSIAARETPRFVELSRALYGPVEPGLLDAAKDLLAKTQSKRRGADGDRCHGQSG
jgi:hypothetical protein